MIIDYITDIMVYKNNNNLVRNDDARLLKKVGQKKHILDESFGKISVFRQTKNWFLCNMFLGSLLKSSSKEL